MNHQKHYSRIQFVYCIVLIAIGAVVIWGMYASTRLLPRSTPMTDKLDELEIAIDELEIARNLQFQAELLAWDTMRAVLDKAWEATWPGPDQPPPDQITGSRVCWHVSDLDAAVDGQLVQVWRCEARPSSCDPAVDLCLDLGGDGVSWEFRFGGNEMGTLILH